MTKRAAPPVSAAEYQHLLDENDALRAELAELNRIRKENTTYIQELWDDNRRLHWPAPATR